MTAAGPAPFPLQFPAMNHPRPARPRPCFRRWLLPFLLLTGIRLAAQPIVVELTATAGEPTALRFEGTDISDVVDSIIARQDELETFAGRPFSAALTYLGYPLAMNLQVAEDGNSATLDIPSIGFSRTFVAASSNELQEQIETFIETEGSSEIAELREVVNRSSAAAITDGNPYATTALFADRLLHAYDLATAGPGAVPVSNRAWTAGLQVHRSTWRAEGLSGEQWRAELRFDRQFGAQDRVTLIVPGNFTDTAGAHTIGGGTALGWSHDWTEPRPDRQLAIRSAGYLGATFRGSENLAAGGGVWAYGVSTGLAHQVTNRVEWGGVAQLNGFSGIQMNYNGFELDTTTNQQLLKLALPLTVQFTPTLTGTVHWTHSRFLQNAAVDTFQTTGVQLRWQVDERVRLSADAELTEGDRFRAQGGAAQIGCIF